MASSALIVCVTRTFISQPGATLNWGGAEEGCIQMCMSTGVKSAVNSSWKKIHKVKSHHEVNRMDVLRNNSNEAFGLIAC